MGEKKAINKWLFMLIATLFNVALIIVLFLVLMVLVSLCVNAFSIPETVAAYLPFAIIVISFVLSFIIYNKVMKWAMKKWKIAGLNDRD